MLGVSFTKLTLEFNRDYNIHESSQAFFLVNPIRLGYGQNEEETTNTIVSDFKSHGFCSLLTDTARQRTPTDT